MFIGVGPSCYPLFGAEPVFSMHDNRNVRVEVNLLVSSDSVLWTSCQQHIYIYAFMCIYIYMYSRPWARSYKTMSPMTHSAVDHKCPARARSLLEFHNCPGTITGYPELCRFLGISQSDHPARSIGSFNLCRCLPLGMKKPKPRTSQQDAIVPVK